MSAALDRTAELMTDADITEVDLHIKRIVLPTDGSATAIEATKVAISLAKCLGAQIVALFVAPGNVEDPMQYIEQEQLEGVKHTAAGLDIARKLAEKNGVAFSSMERAGAVGHEIIGAVKELDANMVVMGTEGRTGLKRLALGSIAESVVKEAHVPVMVVRHGSTEFCMEPRA